MPHRVAHDIPDVVDVVHDEAPDCRELPDALLGIEEGPPGHKRVDAPEGQARGGHGAPDCQREDPWDLLEPVMKVHPCVMALWQRHQHIRIQS